MLTPDELAAIPLFSTLDAADRNRLARTCPDIHLRAGEYAVHEGDERALFAVLAGRIEVTKQFDGIERTLGWRLPGSIFGEVPLALGSPFPGAYRAVEPSRVMRLDARQYYSMAAAHPDVAARVGALAGERIGGLQGIAAEPPKAQLTMVGHPWDAQSADFRRFLALNQVTFESLTPDAPDFAARWPGPPPQAYPAFKLPDGATLVQPGMRVLAEHLGLQTKAGLPEYDAVVVGRAGRPRRGCLWRVLKGCALW